VGFGFSVKVEAQKTLPKPENPFGIVFNIVKNKGYEERAFLRLKELGVQWVRLLIPWDEVEPVKGTYNQAKLNELDNYIERLHAMGIQVIGFLPSGSVPKWAYDQSALNDPSKKIIKGKKSQYQVFPPSAEEMADFVSSLIGRYKNLVKDWIILNEVSSKRKYTSPKELIEILKAVYPAAKKLDPECRIVMAAIGASGWPEYYEEFFALGGGKYIDVIDRHMYWHLSRIMKEMPDMELLQKKYGLDLPVEIGEMADPSYYKVTKNEPGKARGDFDYPRGTAEAQAQLITKRMVLALAYGVERIIESNIRDDGSMEAVDDELLEEKEASEGGKKNRKPEWKIESGYVSTKGIVDERYNPKPAFYAYKTVIQKLTAAKFQQALEFSRDLQCYVFAKDDSFIAAIWAWGKGECDTDINLYTTSSEIIVSDKYGKEVQLIIPQEGKFTVQLIPEPLYIEGKGQLTESGEGA
jgi:hypothetical protein